MVNPPPYRKDKLYWEPFWPNFMAVLKPRFVGFKVPRDMVIGSFGAVGKTLCEVALNIGSAADWQNHWVRVLIVTVVWSFSVLIGDALWRAIASLWTVCRKERFRELSMVVVCVCIVVLFWSYGIWYYTYIHSPHFHVAIVSCSTGQPNMVQRPSTAVTLLFSLNNTGIPKAVRDWELGVKFGGGQEPALATSRLRNFQSVDANGHFVAPAPPYEKDIADEIGKSAITKRVVSGHLDFWLPDYDQESVRESSTTLQLILIDESGNSHSFDCQCPIKVNLTYWKAISPP
jgi:hypothetical protein